MNDLRVFSWKEKSTSSEEEFRTILHKKGMRQQWSETAVVNLEQDARAYSGDWRLLTGASEAAVDSSHTANRWGMGGRISSWSKASEMRGRASPTTQLTYTLLFIHVEQ